MAKRYKAAVIGGSGYGGAELIRRLLEHPDVELARVASVDFIGEPLSAAHPNLEGRSDLRFLGITPAEAAKGMDVVLLGLPHKVSAQKVPELMATGTRIVDLSGDFRLHDAAAGRRSPRPSGTAGAGAWSLGVAPRRRRMSAASGRSSGSGASSACAPSGRRRPCPEPGSPTRTRNRP